MVIGFETNILPNIFNIYSYTTELLTLKSIPRSRSDSLKRLIRQWQLRLDRGIVRRGAADHGHLSGAPPVGAALVVDGASRTAAALGRRHGASDASGLGAPLQRRRAVLCDRARSGRPPRLSEAQLVELARLVEAGPDPVRHGVAGAASTFGRRSSCASRSRSASVRRQLEAARLHPSVGASAPSASRRGGTAGV